MVTQDDVLKALAQEKDEEGKRVVVKTTPLAQKLGTTEGSLRSQLSSLKRKGLVDGSTAEGWIITDAGQDTVDRKERIPVTPEDVGSDLPSKLKYYGQLAGVPPDTILATIEMITSGDAEDLEHVWSAMTDMNVEMVARRKWFNLWRNYLKQGIPPNIKEKVVGTIEETKGEGREEISAATRDRGRDYIIIDDMPVRVGAGAGDFTLQDAKDIIGVRAIRSRAASGGGGFQWGSKDIIDILDKMNEKRTDGNAAKVYALEQTEQGAVLREVKPGEAVTFNPPGGSKPQPLLIIDSEGVVQELKPGLRVGTKPAGGEGTPQKITVVRQTDKGMVKEEHSAGDVIILNSPAPGGAPMVPFPVFDSSGKPILDNEGRPVYANLEPTLRWMGFQADQARAQQKHEALMGLVQTARENIPDGIRALISAAEEAKAERQGQGGGTQAGPAKQVYECGSCHTRFTAPDQPSWTSIKCPNPQCGKTYTKEEIEKT